MWDSCLKTSELKAEVGHSKATSSSPSDECHYLRTKCRGSETEAISRKLKKDRWRDRLSLSVRLLPYDMPIKPCMCAFSTKGCIYLTKHHFGVRRHGDLVMGCAFCFQRCEQPSQLEGWNCSLNLDDRCTLPNYYIKKRSMSVLLPCLLRKKVKDVDFGKSGEIWDLWSRGRVREKRGLSVGSVFSSAGRQGEHGLGEEKSSRVWPNLAQVW